MDEMVAEVFKIFHQEYATRMQTFRPCKPGGEIVESNLVHQFINAWLKKCPDALHALEVPFATKSDTPLTPNSDIEDVLNTGWGNHLDGIVLANGTLYLIEAKRDYPPAQLIKRTKADFDRIHSLELAASLNIMFFRQGVYTKPIEPIKEVKGIILADTWSLTNQKLWQSAHYKGQIDWLADMQREVKDLGIGSSIKNESYALLIAHTQAMPEQLRVINSGL
ncbi:hypothetical protein [Paraglaciecola aestuariivivens]